MKKLLMCIAGAMMVLSLAACSPTKVEVEGEKMHPDGLTPEMMEQKNAEIDPEVVRAGNPDAPKLESAVIYYSNEDGTGLIREMVDVERLDVETVLEQLVEYGVLEEGTEAYSLEIGGGEKAGPGVAQSDIGDGERIGTLDLTQLESLEGDDEKLMLYAIANSFSETFELDKMVILVNGEEYSSSLITDGYLYPMENYEKLN